MFVPVRMHLQLDTGRVFSPLVDVLGATNTPRVDRIIVHDPGDMLAAAKPRLLLCDRVLAELFHAAARLPSRKNHDGAGLVCDSRGPYYTRGRSSENTS